MTVSDADREKAKHYRIRAHELTITAEQYRQAADILDPPVSATPEQEALRERMLNQADAIEAPPLREHEVGNAATLLREAAAVLAVLPSRESAPQDASDHNPDGTMTVEGREYRERLGKAIGAALRQCGISVQYAIAGPSELWDVADLVIQSMPSTRGVPNGETVAPTEEQMRDILWAAFMPGFAPLNEEHPDFRYYTLVARDVLALLPGESREAVEAAQRERDAQIVEATAGSFRAIERAAAAIREADRG